MYVPKPRITATRYRRAHVIENSDAGWIFKEQRPIVLAQLGNESGVRSCFLYQSPFANRADCSVVQVEKVCNLPGPYP